MNKRQIVLKKVSVHNLKAVDLTLNANQLIVFTGVSGSGKSSLAFDTIFVEGQRRYIESLSHSARRFLHEMAKPEAELIEGISPTIAIEQKNINRSPRSTVATLTGIYDYLRVLYARIGIAHCPISGEMVKTQSREKIIQTLQKIKHGKKIIFLAPFARNKKGSFKEEFSYLQSQGILRVRIDDQLEEIENIKELNPKTAHNVDLVIDRIVISKENKDRLAEAATEALTAGKGYFSILDLDTQEETVFSQHAFAKKSNISYPPLSPSDFSFNHPSGMCERCQGLGQIREFDLDKIINPDLSIAEKCCSIAGYYETVRYGNIYDNLARLYKFSVHTPWKNLTDRAKKVFLYGTEKKWTMMQFRHPIKNTRWTEYINWKGVLFEANKRLSEAKSEVYRKRTYALMTEMICPSCNGAKLAAYPAATTLGGKKIYELTNLSIDETLLFFEKLKLNEIDKKIGNDLIKEIKTRLNFLQDVGLHYLTLERSAPTLSGGEAQRVKLASQIGCGLVGSTYVLDEPSIGLHPADHHKLLDTLLDLRDQGNTIIIIEHDRDTIEKADTIVDIGPGAGHLGGEIIAQGALASIKKNKNSLIGAYLSGKKNIPIYKKKKPTKKKLKLFGASQNNLKNIDVEIPLDLFVCISGVSGSGKSSLISDTLYPALGNLFHHSKHKVGSHKKITGYGELNKIIFIDQSPIGRTPRSNPATYTKLFDEIRTLFSSLPQSKMRGFKPGHFSFNVSQGSCPYCKGMGKVKIDMDFLEDAYIICKQCNGKRFSPEILDIRYKGKNIYEVLQMEVSDAYAFFSAIPALSRKLKTLCDVGLDYIHLGQSATTLSGGEAQRIKLAKELSRPSSGDTLYVLDEPTTGLHFHDISKLVDILHRLVEKNNTVIVIEHNMDLVKCADWVIDLGPEGGKKGGRLIASGPPEKLAKTNTSTGKALKDAFHPQEKKKERRKKTSLIADEIIIEKACENNLKDVDVKIPHNKMVVFSGPSGSGKTSLALDTIYAEGQRRYIEALPLYLRQFIKQAKKPSIEKILGLAPTIAIEQKKHLINPRSTVGTITETYDLLRLIYSHMGTAFCPETKEPIKTISKEYVVNKILSLPKKTKVQILAPISLHSGEDFSSFVDRLQRDGYLRIRLNKKYYELDEKIPFNRTRNNEILLVIDRLIIQTQIKQRLYEAVNTAANISNNIVIVDTEKKDYLYNLSFAVEKTGKSYSPITPQSFSFNSERGMCLDCQGLGYIYGANLESNEKILSATIEEVLFELMEGSHHLEDFIVDFFEHFEIDPFIPIEDLPKKERDFFFYGDPAKKYPLKKENCHFIWQGINPILAKAAKHGAFPYRYYLVPMMNHRQCPTCKGARLNELAQNVLIKNLSIVDLTNLSIDMTKKFVSSLSIKDKPFLKDSFDQLMQHLAFMQEIGLGYLSLARSAPTLSGGEMQRLRLARQLGSTLSSCIYILDEPTIGLHPHNSHLLIEALRKLMSWGNSLILVEHDPQILKHADLIYDFGPAAGEKGGKIVAIGTPKEIQKNPRSLTGAYMSGRKKIPLPEKRRKSDQYLKIKNANLHNLKKVKVSFPIEAISCVTGVSGSGKSTLIHDILRPQMEGFLRRKIQPKNIEGYEHFDQIISLDQTPISQTKRSDVSTYSDIMPIIRSFYSSLKLSKAKGLMPRHFSYNHKRGMCRTCFGLGYKTVDLQFLPPVKILCDSCHGYRLNPVSLSITYKNKHLGHVLKLSVDEAIGFFSAIPRIFKRLQMLSSVGLGYLKLGQDIGSLSGGEGQRLRLGKELSKRQTGKTLYLFDEPSIGLHSDDIAKLLPIFQKLADKKNTIIIIEHNIDIIKNADYVVDMGPSAGDMGGQVVYAGTFNKMKGCKSSFTAKYLFTENQ